MCRGRLNQRIDSILVPANRRQAALPLLVALTKIGPESGPMLTDNAAALVGAGALLVMFRPCRRAQQTGAEPDEKGHARRMTRSTR